MNVSQYRAFIIAFAMLVICLLPVLRSGLYSDDLANFENKADIKQVSAFDFLSSAQKNINSWKLAGRFIPVAFYLQETVFYHLHTIKAYKIYILTCDLIAVTSFCLLLYAAGLSSGFIALFVFFYLAEIQFRIQYHDAFTSLHGMYSLLSATMFLSTALMLLYLKQGKLLYYIGSLFFAVITILFSEEGLVLVPLIFVSAFWGNVKFKRAFMLFAPFIILCSSYMFYVIYLQRTGQGSYEGISPAITPYGMMNVFNIQLFSALPFSNLYHQAAVMQLLGSQLCKAGNLFSVILILVLGTYLLRLFVRNKLDESNRQIQLVLIIAVVLYVVPAVILMPSGKYQKEMWYGAGYLPVYIQNFGFAAFLSVAAYYCISSSKLLFKGAFMILGLFTITAAVSALLFNNILIDVVNYKRSMPAEATRNAVKNGLLSIAPAGSTIGIKNDYIWTEPFTYETILKNETGNDYAAICLRSWAPDTAYSTKPCFLLDCEAGDTIYTRLYKMDCLTGIKSDLLVSDTTFNSIRLLPEEEFVLGPKR